MTGKEIAALVKQARTQRNWTQAKLATEAGVDKSVVSRLEKGEEEVGQVSQTKIALTLNLSWAIGIPLEKKLY